MHGPPQQPASSSTDAIGERGAALEFLPDDGGAPTTLQFEDVTRELADRRLAGPARLDDEEVFAKIFLGEGRAKGDAARESSAYEALRRRGINTPEILVRGRVQGPGFLEPDHTAAICFERLEPLSSLNALGVGEDPEAATDSQKRARRGALFALIAALAQHHREGVTQSDMHLGNFLLDGGGIQTLDLGSLRFQEGALSPRRAIDGLAEFLIQLDPWWYSLAPALIDHYRAQGGSAVGDRRLIRNRAAALWRARCRRFGRKVFRSSKEGRLARDRSGTLMVRRAFDRRLDVSDATLRRRVQFDGDPELRVHHFGILWHTLRARGHWQKAMQCAKWNLAVSPPAAFASGSNAATAIAVEAADREPLSTQWIVNGTRELRLAKDLGKTLARFDLLGVRIKSIPADALWLGHGGVEVDIVPTKTSFKTPFDLPGDLPEIAGVPSNLHRELADAFFHARDSMRVAAASMSP